ncbi:DUF1427 family protein [Pantoea sp.]|uniref:DUF1427 family protein n=1 Tax=Pantoea sp. TaxID=69393 RepID=UPI00289E0899|nr:DUF1427 family protein [Pantoea sp.]
MSAGLISLGAGIVIGLLYALLKVRSPAPPAIALVGLLGMLIGEQLTVALLHQHGAHTTLIRHEIFSQTPADTPSAPDRRYTQTG